ncbi:MAG TPA: hypothetical protein VFZ12_03115 [Dehalococcoidia bacterium]|nr:hypothetical protein [Dehalococcoidia bacterium]
MGGRTATILIAGSAGAALLVMTWSVLAALSLAEATPYWLGSLAVIASLGAAFLIFKDLVLWPVRFFGPRFSRLRELIRTWLSSFAGQSENTRGASARPTSAPPPATTRRRH